MIYAIDWEVLFYGVSLCNVWEVQNVFTHSPGNSCWLFPGTSAGATVLDFPSHALLCAAACAVLQHGVGVPWRNSSRKQAPRCKNVSSLH